MYVCMYVCMCVHVYLCMSGGQVYVLWSEAKADKYRASVCIGERSIRARIPGGAVRPSRSDAAERRHSFYSDTGIQYTGDIAGAHVSTLFMRWVA